MPKNKVPWKRFGASQTINIDYEPNLLKYDRSINYFTKSNFLLGQFYLIKWIVKFQWSHKAVPTVIFPWNQETDHKSFTCSLVNAVLYLRILSRGGTPPIPPLPPCMPIPPAFAAEGDDEDEAVDEAPVQNKSH